MLTEALTALAAVGGTAVVQAAGTSAWQGLQQAVAGWFGHEDEERVLIELDRSAHALAVADEAEAEVVRRGEQAAWQARFEAVLAGLGEHEQRLAAETLRALLNAHVRARADGVSSTGDGLAVGGNVEIRADHGSVAALRMGNVSLGNPPRPGPPRRRPR
ncbi:hypothetical protein [Streptomyces sp. sk2.1]|uniref:hypothetical protein n=1 Tax=Streptomyces sp. sk2.1 TaxID=2478959 RepID=UPI0011E82DF1|nr:hypothetical protein [Streptomyces sp. sk2.1]TXS69905.1 hypothetical protein EAO76_24400 [Streptomyces sp. sk2.1]